MTQKDYIRNLIETINILDEGLYWLNRSFSICNKIGIKDEYSDEEFDSFETLTSRFARVCDIISHKVFRSIDAVEFEEGGTLLDIINRAQKRNLVDSIDEFRLLRDLRNQIVHEYVKYNLKKMFEISLKYTPVLFTIIERTKKYCEKYY
jgi:hypothetical protein